MGDAHVQKKNEQKLMSLATFDTQDRLPTQIWYDQLRGDDDGSFSRTTSIKPDKNIDYLTQMPSRESQFRQRILTDRISDISSRILSPQALSSNEITFGPLKKLKSPISALAKEFEQPSSMQRPFNSQNRVSYLAMGPSLHSTLCKVQKLDETGGHHANGVVKAKVKQQRYRLKKSRRAPQTDLFEDTQLQHSSVISKISQISRISGTAGSPRRDVSQLIRNNHKRKQDRIFDSCYPNKFHQDTQIYGKPTSMINKQGIDFGDFMNLSLRRLTSDDLIGVAKNYSGD